MAKAKPKAAERRDDALSRERIVATAVELLDEAGENGLTFRALATRLATGAGALYWHIANKDELLLAASDAVVARALAEVTAFPTPPAAVRGIALVVYDAIDAHPWLGAQLSRAPWESAMLQIFERLGQQVQALGVRSASQFTTASALLSYIVGSSIQNALQGHMFDPPIDRSDFLAAVSAKWKALDAREYPFVRNVVVKQLPKHDDRSEFLAGLDILLSGITGAR